MGFVPAGFETGQFATALLPADAGGVAKFVEPIFPPANFRSCRTSLSQPRRTVLGQLYSPGEPVQALPMARASPKLRL